MARGAPNRVRNTHQHLISDGLGVAVFGALHGANFVTGLHLSLLLSAGPGRPQGGALFVRQAGLCGLVVRGVAKSRRADAANRSPRMPIGAAVGSRATVSRVFQIWRTVFFACLRNALSRPGLSTGGGGVPVPVSMRSGPAWDRAQAPELQPGADGTSTVPWVDNPAAGWPGVVMTVRVGCGGSAGSRAETEASFGDVERSIRANGHSGRERQARRRPYGRGSVCPTRTIAPVPGAGPPAVVLISSAYSLPWRKARPRTFSTPVARTFSCRDQ